MTPEANYVRNSILLLIWLISLSMAVFADSRPTTVHNLSLPEIADYGRPVFRVYTDKEGLPQNSIQTITEDKRGYLWIGTQNGAAYYDGQRWTSVRLPDDVATNSVRAIQADSDGSIWFGRQSGGLVQLKDDRWTVFNRDSGLPTDRVYCLLSSKDDAGNAQLWVGTFNGGVACRSNNRWTIFNKANSGLPDDRVWDIMPTIAPDGQRVLWFSTSAGIACLKNNRWISYDVKSGLPNQMIGKLLETIEADGKRTIWACTFGGGLVRLEITNPSDYPPSAANWTVINERDGLPSNMLTNGLVATTTPNGKQTLWVSTVIGLARWKDNRWHLFDSNSGLPSDQVASLFKVVNSNGAYTIWIGTVGGGLARLQSGGWTSFTNRTGLPNSHIYGMAVTTIDGRPNYWIGTKRGLARFSNGSWQSYDIKSGLPNNTVSVILPAQKSSNADYVVDLWVGMDGGGLARLQIDRADKLHWQKYSNAQLTSKSVWSLLETTESDGRRRLWIGTYSNGLVSIDLSETGDDKWNLYNKKTGFASDSVWKLLETRSANGESTLWAGSQDGLLSLRNGQWTVYDTSAGLPNNQVESLLATTTLDGRAILWVGTTAGAVQFDLATNRVIKVFNDRMTPTLPGNFIYEIREDNKKRIYLFTNRGIARITPTANGAGEYQIYTFNTEDGLPSVECTFQGSLIDQQGRIWAGTTSGLAVFDPAEELSDNYAKPLYLQKALLKGREENIIKLTEANRQFAYDQNNLIFEYSLLSYFREAETSYQTFLQGFDRKISNWSNTSFKEYTNLPAGDYCFQVWGRDYAGNISGPVSFTFTIKPALWLTWPAYLCYVGMFGLLGYGVVRFRWLILERRNRELALMVNERTAEIYRQNQRLTQQRDEIEAKNNKIIDSIQYAERIQQALLPQAEQLASSLPDTFIIFKPKDIVSGDFYWLREHQGSIILAVADCTGHGVPGAFMSMIGHTLLNQVVQENRLTDPALILMELHKGIRLVLKQSEAQQQPQDGMDIALCRIDPAQRCITFAGANRPLYYVDRSGKLQEIKGDRQSIGGKQRVTGAPFTNHELSMDNLKMIYLVTDGFADQNGRNSVKYGSKRLKLWLQAHANDSLTVQQQALLRELADYQGDEAQRDDITVLALSISQQVNHEVEKEHEEDGEKVC